MRYGWLRGSRSQVQYSEHPGSAFHVPGYVRVEHVEHPEHEERAHPPLTKSSFGTWSQGDSKPPTNASGICAAGVLPSVMTFAVQSQSSDGCSDVTCTGVT